MLNKSKGNMYDWTTNTYNAISGACPHACSYCYVRIFYDAKHPQPPLHLNEKMLNVGLGTGKTIFVGSGCDMFADSVPKEWIGKVLAHCKKFDNTYLFQSKDPMRFGQFLDQLPEKVILGTTIETDDGALLQSISKAPHNTLRCVAIHNLGLGGFRTMISVEPVIKFDVAKFAAMLIGANPEFISIGADSKKNNLPEPSKQDIKELIEILEAHKMKVIQKPNLKRITG